MDSAMSQSALLPWIDVTIDECWSEQEVEILGEVWTWKILITSIIICNSDITITLNNNHL